jgi:alpha-beta hydrolase superfamily lysophospholipase
VPAPAPIPMDQLFAANADLTGLEAYLDAQDPLKLKPRVPVLLQAGEADTQVALAGVRGLRQAYCAYGTSVAFRSYPKLDHRPMLVDPAPRADADAWIDRVVTGKKPENSCA